jgi:predicted phosphoribosyltransferase
VRNIDTTGGVRFRDRREAGRVLARELSEYAGRDDVVVLALPRGGIPVGYEVAKALGAPLEVFVARKLGVPGYPELAMGAIGGGGSVVLDEGLVRRLGVTRPQLEQTVADEARELERREAAYRGERDLPDLKGKTVILVDDGLATGATMRAAVLALRGLEPARIVVAVPVAAEETCHQFRDARRRHRLRRDTRAVLRGRHVVPGFRPDDRRRGARAARAVEVAGVSVIGRTRSRCL